MKKEDCFYLGIIAKKYSFKGEVILKLDTDQPEIYENLDAILVDFGKALVPYFVEKSLFQKGNQLRIQFEEVYSEQEADKLLKKDAYLPLNLLPKLEGTKFYYHEISGFMLPPPALSTVSKLPAIIVFCRFSVPLFTKIPPPSASSLSALAA